jgi:hypothetical protein
VSEKSVRGGMWWNFVQHVKEDLSLNVLETRLGNFNEPEVSVRLAQNAVVIMLNAEMILLRVEALQIGEPEQAGRSDCQPVG